MNKKKTIKFQEVPIGELLSNTHVAPFQRLKDKEHLEDIYNGILQYYLFHKEIFLPNLVSLASINHKDNKKDKMIILDGQHRMGALSKLVKEYPETSELIVRTDIYYVENDEEAREIYNIINSSKKVELYTGNIAPYVIPVIKEYFEKRFERYCKKTQNPKGVNINLEQLDKRIQAYNLIDKAGISLDTIDTLIEHIKELNHFYSLQSIETLVSYGHKETLVKELKESNDDFYLGLYKKYEWIERIIELYVNKTPYDKQDHFISEKKIKIERKKIPSALRANVWKKRYSQIMGECFCCEKEISVHEFECGHIVSVRDGGQNTLDNLEPICKQCNGNMGTINLLSYKKLFI
jgi:hypothetical protein